MSVTGSSSLPEAAPAREVGRSAAFEWRGAHAAPRLPVARTMICRRRRERFRLAHSVGGLSMRTIDDYGAFADAVARAGPHARELAYQLRALVAAVMPEVVEVPWPKMRMASYGVGPKKKSEHFCYISAQKDD